VILTMLALLGSINTSHPGFAYSGASNDLGGPRGSNGSALRKYAPQTQPGRGETHLSVLAEAAFAQTPPTGAASFFTTTLSIPTYPYKDHLSPAYSPAYNMTYSKLHWGTYSGASPVPIHRNYQLLVLENDFLYVTLMPELGGRIYQMVFKPTGHNELYQNPVIKPTPFGPLDQGWWLAIGGIEWCLPVDEHGYEWGEPWSYQVITSTKGVTVTLRDTTAANRIRAAVSVHLPADRGYLVISPRIENPTGHDIDYQYWTNGMLAPGPANTVSEHLNLVYNADEMSVHSTGDHRLPGYDTTPTGPDYRFSWPVYHGTDFSRLGNWRAWLGFFEYPQAAAGFSGVYDTAANEGVVRVFSPDVARGSKGFAFGWSALVDSIKWTDDGSAYFELHGGVAPTFWEQATIAAGQSLAWTEHWYPVSAIGQLSAATTEAALGVQHSGDRFTIGVHATRRRAAGDGMLYVWDRDDCTPLGTWELPEIGPGDPVVISAQNQGRPPERMAIVYLDKNDRVLAAINPRDCLPPSSSIETLDQWVGTSDFPVTWSGQDGWTGIDAYDVQVREGYKGAWRDWLTNTTATSAVFSGVHGRTYFFRVRARDVYGNQAVYTDQEWGQAFTTVLTDPAPVLVTSRKSATPRLFSADETVFYTIRISNTGNLTANATLIDTLPPGMHLLTHTLTATAGLTLIPPHTLHWAGAVPPGSEARVTYVLSPTATPLGAPLMNIVEISGSVLGPLTRREVVARARFVWLPVVTRG
jgi:uncharacterized repeat protein (TIGR01451 family)